MKTEIVMMAALAIPTAIFAQQKTYFDEEWKVTTADKMAYYRETTKEGSLYRIKDFYKNGTLQMDGLSHNDSPTEEVWEGKVTWYNEDGSVEYYTTYKNGKMNGETGMTRPNGDYSRAMYKDDEVISSEYLSHKTDDNYSSYQKFDGKTTTSVYFDEDIKGIRMEEISNGDGTYTTKFYGEGGKYIGQATNNENGLSGTYVSYYSNPMRVQQIDEYKNSVLVYRKAKYSTGELKNEFKKNDKSAQDIYYDKKGKIIGKLDYIKEADSEDFKPQKGVMITFDDDKFSQKDYYENGSVYKQENYKDGVLWQTKDFYESEGNSLPKKLTTYNPDGSVRFVLNYKDGEEYEGTYIDDGFQRDYKAGKMMHERSWYDDGKTHCTKDFVNEYEYKGTTYLKTGEKYNDFILKDSQSGYFSGTVTPYVNGKRGQTFVFEEGVLQKGSGKLRYFTVSDTEPVEIENDGKNFYFRTYKDGELSKEVRVPVKFLDIGTISFQEDDVYRTEGNTSETTVANAAAAVAEAVK